MRISDWSSDVCSSDLAPAPISSAARAALSGSRPATATFAPNSAKRFAMPRLIPLVPPATKAVFPASRLSRNVDMAFILSLALDGGPDDAGLKDRNQSPFETGTDSKDDPMASAGPTSNSFISQRLKLHYVDWGNRANGRA